MLERRAYGEPNKYEHSWKAVGEDEDGEDIREARLTVDHLAQRNPAAAALFQSRTRPAADAARARRDGDRRFQTMSGAGRHA